MQHELSYLVFVSYSIKGCDGYLTATSGYLTMTFAATFPYYVWYNLDGASVDPAPADHLPIQVDIVTGQTDEEIARATSDAIGEATNPDIFGVFANTSVAFLTFNGEDSAQSTPNSTLISVVTTSPGQVPTIADVDTGLAFATLSDGLSTHMANYHINWSGVAPVDEGTLGVYPTPGNKYYNLSMIK